MDYNHATVVSCTAICDVFAFISQAYVNVYTLSESAKSVPFCQFSFPTCAKKERFTVVTRGALFDALHQRSVLMPLGAFERRRVRHFSFSQPRGKSRSYYISTHVRFNALRRQTALIFLPLYIRSTATCSISLSLSLKYNAVCIAR